MGKHETIQKGLHEGNYERVRELSPNSSKEDLSKDYTVGKASKNAYNIMKKDKGS